MAAVIIEAPLDWCVHAKQWNPGHVLSHEQPRGITLHHVNWNISRISVPTAVLSPVFNFKGKWPNIWPHTLRGDYTAAARDSYIVFPAVKKADIINLY